MEFRSRAGSRDDQEKTYRQITFKGYTVHASEEEPQYLIKSDRTDHLAMHKGSALKLIANANHDPKKTAPWT